MLRPYATKSKISAKIRYKTLGRCSPIKNPTISEPSPENIPLSMTISLVFRSAIFRVQLFSRPQHDAAKSIKIDPQEKDRDDISSVVKRPLAITTRKIATHKYFEIASLNIKRAIREVATISKLFKSAAVEALTLFRPPIKRIGAMISKTIIAKV